jgi:O-antigen ligase
MENLAKRGIDPATRRVIGQAHSTPLHLAATTGLIGVALAACVVIVGLRGAARPLTTASDWGSYDAAPFFALLGMCLVSVFETLHVNAQTTAVMSFLIALCVWPGPVQSAARHDAQP